MKKRINQLLAVIFAVVLLTTALPLSAIAANVNEMTDVSSGQWYYNAVSYCLEKEYMRGVGVGQFAPEGIVTRAQMAQTLYNRAEDNSVDMTKNIFSDVSITQWYAPPIIWCQQQHVINGTSATTFAPNGSVTREQVCVMVYNFYKGYLGKTPELADISSMRKYTDWPSVSSWAQEAVRWAVQTKFMSGKSSTTLAPNGQATRAELAQFLMNFDKVLEDTGGTEPTPPTHPYTASTLTRAELRYSYSELLMTLDKDENLVYYDKKDRTVYRIGTDMTKENRRETLLNAENAVCTVSIDGSNVTYKNLDVTQVFYDSVQDRLILQGEFSAIDTSANDGWENPDAPDKYSGAFVFKNGQLELLMPYKNAQFKAVFLCAMTDGKYLISDQTSFVNYGGEVRIWDPYTNQFTTLSRSDNAPKPYRYAVQDGQDIYAVSVGDESFFTHIHKYNFATKRWDDISTAHCRYIASRDGLFYGWDYDGSAIAIRPTGETKTLYNISQDVLVTDLTALPDSPLNLLVTSSGMFIFYDDDARAIRAVYPTPQQTTPTPQPTPPQFDYAALSRKLSGDWVNTDGFSATMKVSATQTTGCYSIEITGGDWAQMYAVWSYEAVYDEASETLKCSTGSRTDYSRFGTNTVYAGTGQAVFTLFDNGMLRWDNVSEQNAEDLTASTVTFQKT